MKDFTIWIKLVHKYEPLLLSNQITIVSKNSQQFVLQCLHQMTEFISKYSTQKITQIKHKCGTHKASKSNLPSNFKSNEK